MELHIKEEQFPGGKIVPDHEPSRKYFARRMHTGSERATTLGNHATPVSSSSGTPIRGARVSPRPGAALALAAAASRQVARTTSTSLPRGPHFEQGTSSRPQLESGDFSFEDLTAREIVASIPFENDIPRNQVAMTESISLQSQGTAEETPELSSDSLTLDDHLASVDMKKSSLSTVFDWKSRNLSPSVDMEHDAVGANGISEHSLKAMPSFSDALAQVHIIDDALPQLQPMPSPTKHREILQQAESTDSLIEQNEILQEVEPMDSLLNHYSLVQDEEEDSSNVQKLQNLIGDVDGPEIFTHNDIGDSSSDEGYHHRDHDYAGSISSSEESSDSGRGLINMNQDFLSDDIDEAVTAPETNVEQKGYIIEMEPRRPPTALQLAEEVEMRNATSGLHWEEGAAAQPMRLEGIQRGPPAIGLLQLDAYNTLSQALASPFVRREHGFPQALTVHVNFIAVGLSKGAVLVTPSKYSATRSADELESQKAFFLGGGIETKEPVSSLCFSHQGDLLLVGYANGVLRLWDVSRRSMSKMMSTEHSEAIVHTLFLGQDAPGARSLRVISGDCKGRLLHHSFSQQIMPLLRRFSVETHVIAFIANPF